MADIHPPLEDNGPLWMQTMMREIGSPAGECPVARVLLAAQVKPPDDYIDPAVWLSWGYDVKTPEYGCVVCLDDRIGLFQRQDGFNVFLVGSNQSNIDKPDPDAVIQVFEVDEQEIISCRWPQPEDFKFGEYPRDDRADDLR